MNREKYLTTRIQQQLQTKEGWEVGEKPLFAALHAVLSNVSKSISWTLNGAGDTVAKMGHVAHTTLARMPKEDMERFGDRARMVESYLIDGQAIYLRREHGEVVDAIDMPPPSAEELRQVLSQAYHLLDASHPLGDNGRRTIEAVLQTLELETALPDRTALRAPSALSR